MPRTELPGKRNQSVLTTLSQTLYKIAHGFEQAIRAGKDARHLWYALKDWNGADPEDFFGELGVWADGRMAEIEANSGGREMVEGIQTYVDSAEGVKAS